MSDILWRRLRYMLSPQWDLYNSIAQVDTSASVVDIGCGTGYGTIQLFDGLRGGVTGIDIDGAAIQFARDSFPFNGLEFVLWDITKTPEPEMQFETAVMVEVLEHIPDYHAALTNVRNMLTPGGRAYITARNANADLRRNELHEREWTAMEFVRALEKHFDTVQLYDHTLMNEQDIFTHKTPLIAVATVRDSTPALAQTEMNGPGAW